MKILITGKNGFLGSYFVNNPFEEFEYHAVGREDVDLLDNDACAHYFNDKFFDVIVHTAIKGANGEREPNMLEDNVDMFHNAYNIPHNIFINIGSGVEFDKNQKKDGDNYAKSKETIYNFLSTEWLLRKEKNFNLRIYGAFGPTENEKRFFKSAIKNVINERPVEIHGNRLFSFFYIEDVRRVLEEVVRNYSQYEDYFELNLIYPSPDNCKTLVDYGKDVLRIAGSDVGLDVQGSTLFPYFSTGKDMEKFLEESSIELVGLENGMKEMYETLKSEKT